MVTAETSFDLDRWQAGGLSSFSESCFADYWDDLPDLSTTTSANTKTKPKIPIIIDPYNVLHRMALGKYIIEHTGGESAWGPACQRHWFWGYLAQLDWQQRSGRLADPTTTKANDENNNSNIRIATNSWWGYMNLNFSVAVYVGAAKAGLVPEIQLLMNDVEQDVGFQKCVEHWKLFWETAHPEYLSELNQEGSVSKGRRGETAIDRLYPKLWETHSAIIQSAVPCATDLEKLLPDEDRRMGLGWCHMVELLASMQWTLLSMDALLQFGAGYLPTCRLDPDSLQWLKENRPLEHTTALSLFQLHDASPRAISMMQSFWSRLAYYKHQRDIMPYTLHSLTHGSPVEKGANLIKVLTLVMLPHSAIEWAVLAALFAACYTLVLKRK